MEKSYVCDRCGQEIEYRNTTWRDNSGGNHIVCDDCNEVLSEDYSEDELPSPESFMSPSIEELKT